MRASLVRTAWLSFLLVAGAANANDRWDAGAPDCGDNTFDGAMLVAPCNQLLHGRPQEHDVQATSPTRDIDFSVVETKARHSYEVVVHSASTTLGFTGNSAATRANRINAGGAILTSSIAPDGAMRYSDTGGWLAIRWIGGASNQRDYIRVEGMGYQSPNSNSRYVIELLDTTYFIPRFNNSGSQVTVLLIQNTKPDAVTGSIFFYSAAGALLHTEPLSVPVAGLQIVSTSSIGALAGQSGSVTIAHLGGYGALAAKAVALEPATGFSFDTIAMPVPR